MFYFIISLLPVFIYLVFKSKKAVHILQQNWYNDGNRYIKWVMNNFEKVFVVFDVLFVIIVFLKNILIFSSFYLTFILRCVILITR